MTFACNDTGLSNGVDVKGGEDGEVIDIKFPSNFSGCPIVAFKSCIGEYDPGQRVVTWKKKMPTHINDSAITSCTVDSQATVFTGHQCGRILTYVRNRDSVTILPLDIGEPVLTMDIMPLP